MTSTEVAVVPDTGDVTQWSPQQLAIMEFAGLSWTTGPKDNLTRVYAPRAVVEAFANAVKRTKLDPTAKQIYAAEMGGRWSIIVGIDGMRVVAQRTGEYLGATPIQWTADGVTWVDVWLSKDKPAAARIGINRKGFAEPLISVITWEEFGKTSGQWPKMPAHMLGIRVESHALRRAFPNDLSGLYTIEDVDGDVIAEVAATEPWTELILKVDDKADLEVLANRIRGIENGEQVRDSEMTGDLRTMILTRAGVLVKDSRPTSEQPTEEEAAAKQLGSEPAALSEEDYEAQAAAEFAAAQDAGEA